MPRPMKYSDHMVQLEARLIVEFGLTYRRVADRLHIPQSTVAHHMKYRLKDVSWELYEKISKIELQRNRNAC